MISFIEFLKEDRVDFLKNLFMPKYHNDSKKIDAIIAIDPTHNKAYAQWLLNLGLKDVRIIEDGPRIKNDLTLFDKVKNRLDVDKRDINKFKSQSDLFNAIEPYSDFKSGKEIKADEREQFKKEIKTVYKGPEGSIEIPLTERASCFLGRGTRWCTAAKNNNMFNHYNELGPLYIINTKNNMKYQFHLPSSQLMDDNDFPVRFEDIDNHYPWVFKNINFSEKEQMEAVRRGTSAFKYIKNPSEKVQMEAVKYNHECIKYIKNPSEAVQMEAVKNYGFALELIENPSKKVQLEAVKSHPMALKYIKNPSEEIQLAAVSNEGLGSWHTTYPISYINNPSEKVQLASVQANPYSIRNIQNPSEKIQIATVKEKPSAIGHIMNPSEKIQLIAAEKDTSAALFGISMSDLSQSDEMKMLVVKNAPHLIGKFKTLSEKIQMMAVEINTNYFQDIRNPTEKVQEYVVKKSPYSIKYIDNPSEKVQIEAVKAEGFVIKYINNPSEKVKYFAEISQYEILKQIPHAVQHANDIRLSERIQTMIVQHDKTLFRYLKEPYQSVIDYVKAHNG